MADDFLCPAPLVGYNPESTSAGEVISAATGCAIPCPSLLYSDNEWDTMKDVLFVGSLVSMISSFLVLISHLQNEGDFNKYYLRIQFIGGFFALSLICFIFQVCNQQDALTCNNESHFRIQSPLCVFQAFCTVYVFLWIEYWSFILALDAYLLIRQRAILISYGLRSQQQQQTSRRRMYTLIGLLFCTSLSIIPLLAKNYGFDPYQVSHSSLLSLTLPVTSLSLLLL